MNTGKIRSRFPASSGPKHAEATFEGLIRLYRVWSGGTGCWAIGRRLACRKGRQSRLLIRFATFVRRWRRRCIYTARISRF